MSITQEEVKKIAKLARFAYSQEDIEIAQKELNGIMHWVDQLAQVDTQGVENYTDLATHSMPEREDVVCDGGYVTQVLANAPDQAHGMFSVPKVIE